MDGKDTGEMRNSALRMRKEKEVGKLTGHGL
jgi:hypothetical protein